MNSTIFSIGHGNRSIESFVELLSNYGIEYLIDVRSIPYSKYNPQFNKNELDIQLRNNGITYTFLGNKLGGLPSDRNYYTDGKVDYKKLREADFFVEGLERLKNAHQKGIRVAIMCSESKPQECHRSKLIGTELLSRGICINHITESGKLKDQVLVMQEFSKGLGWTDLFGEETNMTSRKKRL